MEGSGEKQSLPDRDDRTRAVSGVDDAEDFDLEQVKWVVLMVLSSQPGQEQACARMEDLVFDNPESAAH